MSLQSRYPFARNVVSPSTYADVSLTYVSPPSPGAKDLTRAPPEYPTSLSDLSATSPPFLPGNTFSPVLLTPATNPMCNLTVPAFSPINKSTRPNPRSPNSQLAAIKSRTLTHRAVRLALRQAKIALHVVPNHRER